MFCLADGTPLTLIFDLPEEETIVRNDLQIPPAMPAKQKSGSLIIFYLAGGVLALFLAIGAVGAVAYLALSGLNTPSETGKKDTRLPFPNTPEITKNKEATPTPTKEVTPTPDREKEEIDKEKAELKQKQDALERERKKLEEDRKRLEERKNTPEATPEKPPERTYPPQPTARIKFSRGSVSQTVSGRVGSERSFVLEARSGQYLLGSVSSGGGCVTFRGGSSSAGFTTSSGDNRLTLVNNCSSESSFSLTVAIR